MAYSFISASQAKNEGASPVTATYAATPTQGNLLICVVRRNSQSGSVTVSDSNGNWTQEVSLNFNGSSSQILVFVQLASASQPTAITSTGTGTHFVDIYEFSGNQNTLTGIVDASNTGSALSGTTSSGSQPSVTTTNAGDLIFTTIGFSSAVTSPSWTGATMLQQNFSGTIDLVDGYQIETSTGTYNPYASWTNIKAWGQITLAFLPASGTSWTLSLYDTVASSDTLSRTVANAPSDTVISSDTLKRAFSLPLTETIVSSDDIMVYKDSPVIWYSPCNTTADFTSINQNTGGGETVTITANGYLGNAVNVNITTATSNEVGVRKDLSNKYNRIWQFRFEVASGVTWSSGQHCLAHIWSDNYASNLIEIRINKSGSGFNLQIVDPNNGYSATTGSTLCSLGTYYKVCVAMTDSGYTLWLDNPQNNAAEVTYNPTYSLFNTYMGIISVGKFYTTTIAGHIYLDDFYTRVERTKTSLSNTNKALDTIDGFYQQYMSWDGAIVRPAQINGVGNEGNGTTQGCDIVSESQAYGMMFAAQTGNKTYFDLIWAWTKANMQRVNNGGLSTGTHLIAWHYDNIGNTVLDWNNAADADLDIMLALYWADNLWGSGGTINYLSDANNMASDFESYMYAAYGGSNYLYGDLGQSGNTNIEQATSYFATIAMKMAGQHRSSSATFWTNLVTGSYDVFTQTTATTGALATTDGLHPNWNFFNTSTGLVAVDTNSGRDTRYGYNAFRTPIRLYWDTYFYSESRATTLLTGNFYTFMSGQWSSGTGTIKAEYNHDGTIYGSYEKTQMYATDMWSFVADGDTTNANSIYSNKIINTYTNSPAGAYWSDNATTTGNSIYFNNTWVIFSVLTKEGYLTNYGQGTSHTLSLSDLVVSSDSIIITISNLLSESIQSSDGLTRSPKNVLSDSIVSVDSTYRTTSFINSDSTISSDSLSRTINNPISDQVSSKDSISRGFSSSLSDFVISSDSLSRTYANILSENISSKDTLVKVTSQNLADSVLSNDVMTSLISIIVSDAVVSSDSLTTSHSSGGTAHTLSLFDTVVSVDALTMSFNNAMSDFSKSSDSIVKSTGKQNTVSVPSVDAITKTTAIINTESIPSSDSIKKGITFSLFDKVVSLDSIAKNITNILADVIKSVDSFTYSYIPGVPVFASRIPVINIKKQIARIGIGPIGQQIIYNSPSILMDDGTHLMDDTWYMDDSSYNLGLTPTINIKNTTPTIKIG